MKYRQLIVTHYSLNVPYCKGTLNNMYFIHTSQYIRLGASSKFHETKVKFLFKFLFLLSLSFLKKLDCQLD